MIRYGRKPGMATTGWMSTRARPATVAGPQRQRGSAIIEYSIITFLAVIVLVSQENQIARIMEAIRDLYEAFSFSLSMTFPTPD